MLLTLFMLCRSARSVWCRRQYRRASDQLSVASTLENVLPLFSSRRAETGEAVGAWLPPTHPWSPKSFRPQHREPPRPLFSPAPPLTAGSPLAHSCASGPLHKLRSGPGGTGHSPPPAPPSPSSSRVLLSPLAFAQLTAQPSAPSSTPFPFAQCPFVSA